MDHKKTLLNFIKKHELAVISTVTLDAKPESAVIGFGETEHLELIFGTFNSSRKYKNIESNGSVSFVIGWEDNITVQYEGKATELSGKLAKKYSELYFLKNPRARKFAKQTEQRYFLVSPKWIRYSDFKTEPPSIIETTF